MAESLPTTQTEEDRITKPTLKQSRAFLEHSGRPGKRQRLTSPPAMTAIAAAAANAEQRARHKTPDNASLSDNQTSPNPQAEALGLLMGVTQHATSKISDATPPQQNPATTMSQPLEIVAQNLQIPADAGIAVTGDTAQTSPVSLSSIGTIGTTTASATLGPHVGSPQPMDDVTRGGASGGESASPDDANKSISYPAPNFLQPQAADASRRGMSLPTAGTRQGTRSPSSKKHKCPYCSTEFTRHHNLKSHLLTHSQEKPYVCSTCNSRFRRLHDLKRHTKLHTGERPHVCPKCDRKFARGDALARHNKGPGGCAGRRASMGSFGGDDDGDADGDMEGIVYDEPNMMEDEDGISRGAPQIRRQAPSGDETMDDPSYSSRMPSTYPPIQGRPPGGMAGNGFVRPSHGPQPPPPPPGPNYGNASGQYVSSGSTSSLRPGSQVFAQNPMTESPTPISPSQRQNKSGGPPDLGRNRSPSNPQYPQASYPPRGSSSGSSLAPPLHAPQLPPPHALNPPDPRFTLPSQGGPTHPPTQPSGPPTHMSGSGPLSSHSNSSSHGRSAVGSGDKGGFPTNEERLWAYVRNMEQNMNNMVETINLLREEIAGLKNMITGPQRA